MNITVWGMLVLTLFVFMELLIICFLNISSAKKIFALMFLMLWLAIFSIFIGVGGYGDKTTVPLVTAAFAIVGALAFFGILLVNND